jgi:hypothetical protein
VFGTPELPVAPYGIPSQETQVMTGSPRRALALAALLATLVAGPLADAASAAPSVGDKAPDFGGTWINRANTTLAELRGRVVFIEFWRTW